MTLLSVSGYRIPTARSLTNLVPHNALYNCGRMQEVWLDK
jgi:hypothetical protein